DAPACPLHWSHVKLPASASAPEEIGEQDLDYILYTSGSTDTTKVIAHNHHTALALAERTNQSFALEARERFDKQATFNLGL
ncbi:D-alanine--poly(phosphoribitol) ligase, partial [Pseudomonas aeruginosa]